jgi:serine/threonine protein kinase
MATEYIKTIECPKCRYRNEVGTKFCADCGADLTGEVLIVCGDCGSENKAKSKFCGNCGNNLENPQDNDPDIRHLQEALKGKYIIQKPLGEGGFGRVFLAEHKGLGQMHVIKLLSADSSRSTEIRNRFFQEAKVLAKLKHPNIVPIMDVAEFGGRPYYVMSYLNGGSLADLLQKEKNLSVEKALEYIQKLLSALSEVHEKGIIHRDIKPENVLLDEKGEPFLIDFGIARVEESSKAKTATGFSIGTPQYMSPEQLDGKPITLTTDIYSMGIMLFELLTGKPPYEGSFISIANQHKAGKIPSISGKIQETHLLEEIQAILERACAKEASARYNSAKEMSLALESINLKSKTSISKKTIQEEIQIQESKNQKKLDPGFIQDFLYPFRKELSWKSILIKQLRIFLIISVILFVLFLGFMKDILMEIPACKQNNMKMDGVYCYYESDRINLENAESICKANYKDKSSKEEKSCIKKNYIGKIYLSEFMEKPYYEFRINYLEKYIYLIYIIFSLYPIYITFQVSKYILENFKYLFLSIIVISSLYLLTSLLLKKDIWIGIIYPDKSNLYIHKIIGEFGNLNSCLDKVNSIIDENGTYECALNCKTETTPMICEKTVGNEK